jgi:hypothetical protein
VKKWTLLRDRLRKPAMYYSRKGLEMKDILQAEQAFIRKTCFVI